MSCQQVAHSQFQLLPHPIPSPADKYIQQPCPWQSTAVSTKDAPKAAQKFGFRCMQKGNAENPKPWNPRFGCKLGRLVVWECGWKETSASRAWTGQSCQLWQLRDHRAESFFPLPSNTLLDHATAQRSAPASHGIAASAGGNPEIGLGF